MDHMSNLRSKCAFASQNSFKMVRDFCLIIVFIINVYVFIFYKKEVRENKAYTVNIDYTPLVLAVELLLRFSRFLEVFIYSLVVQ